MIVEPSPVSDLISVVIPTHNRRDRLVGAIASAKAQTWPSLEIVVVDDASSDGTAEYLQRLAVEDSAIRFVRNKAPLGGGGARNAGLAAASGELIAFLDDDDEWLPDKLACQHALLVADPAAAAVSCSFLIAASGGRDVVTTLHPPADEQSLLWSNHLGGASMCLAARSTLISFGGFDPKLRSGQDWDLWLKLAERGRILVCSEPLVRYMPHEGSRITGNRVGEYRGRRRIHMRYRQRMAADTRRHSLCELAFLRKVALRSTWWERLGGLAWVVACARGRDRLRFPWRLARMARTGETRGSAIAGRVGATP